MKDYYELLQVPRSAGTEDIKHAFRLLIARYHPDKVQHLGREFQAMAADRAAELTEAYRVLFDAGRRAAYDRALDAHVEAAESRAPRTAAASVRKQEAGAATRVEEQEPAHASDLLREQREVRDRFVRRAAVGKLRASVTGLLGAFDEPDVAGFDIVAVPRPKRFARSRIAGPRLLGRFVPRVDGAAVAETWVYAGRWGVPAPEDVCVLLMGPSMVPAPELAAAIAQQRRRTSGAARARIIVIPVEVTEWRAHVPIDTPPLAKDLLARLRGSR